MSDLELYNSTLREGTQQSGVQFGISQMIEIADGLFDTGIADIVEVHCYPGRGGRGTEHAKIMIERFGDKIVTHHRSYGGDIDNRAGIGPGNTSMFLSVSPQGLEAFELDYQRLKNRIGEDITHATDSGLTVAKYALEHATDTDPDILKELAITAQDAGAQRVSIPDTRGGFDPREYSDLMEFLMTDVKQLVTHCHNDLGLALANTLAAYDSGVKCLDSSVLGLGERAGQTRTEQLVTLLNIKRGEDIPIGEILMMVELVNGLTGVYPGPHDPIVGENVFVHRAGTHAHKIIRLNGSNRKHPYLPFDPKIVGGVEDFSLSPLSGSSTIEAMLLRYDIVGLEREKITEIAERVRCLAETNGTDVISREFEGIAANVLSYPYNLEYFARRRAEPERTTYRILIRVDGDIPSVIRRIRKEVRAARYIDEIYGESDVFVTIPGVSSDLGNSYVDIIKSIPGVERTTTYVSARSWK